MATEARLSRIAINKILLATDFSPESANALQCALALARRYDSKLFITHALPPAADTRSAEVPVPLQGMLQRDAERNMTLLAQNEELRTFPHQMILCLGDPAQVLSKVISNEDIDLVVMSTHGRGGLGKLRAGSTTENLMRHATCPVLSVGANIKRLPVERFGQILFATHFSTGSRRALTYALSLAEEDRAELTLLYVIESNPHSESELVRWKRENRDKLSRLIPPFVDLPSQPEAEVEIGSPGTEIVRLADSRNADLVVMGSRRGGILATHLPWSTLHHVVQRACCPVLTVCAY
jgi:nucleotide-binding universal stress UspA family protein